MCTGPTAVVQKEYSLEPEKSVWGLHHTYPSRTLRCSCTAYFAAAHAGRRELEEGAHNPSSNWQCNTATENMQRQYPAPQPGKVRYRQLQTM